MRSLYLECGTGISGDMIVAALLDLGASEEVLRKALAGIKDEGFDIEISRVMKAGIDCCDFNVVLDKEHENHDHDMEYLYGHEHGEDAGHEHAHGHHDHDHQHHHGEGHHHEHHHDHHHDHGHHHSHRGLQDIVRIIDGLDVTPGARFLAKKTFLILAEAEAKAHRKMIDEVHFHEAGAIDSIVDIVAAAVCFDDLGIEEVIIPRMAEGQGSVRCQHGILPVPVPAVANIAQRHGLPLAITSRMGELTTPTGAAFAAAVMTSQELPEVLIPERVGIGAGKREYKQPSMVRAILFDGDKAGAPAGAGRHPEAAVTAPAGAPAGDGRLPEAGGFQPAAGYAAAGTQPAPGTQAAGTQPAPGSAAAGAQPTPGAQAAGTQPAPGSAAAGTQSAAGSAAAGAQPTPGAAAETDTIWKLETNIDDSTGEQLGFVMERLLKAGARDVFYTPIYMKKNRPAWLLSIIATEDKVAEMEDIVFTHTSTIGIRKAKMERSILPRRQEQVMTEFGPVDVKVCAYEGEERVYPEYHSVSALAAEAGVTLEKVRSAAIHGFWKNKKDQR